MASGGDLNPESPDYESGERRRPRLVLGQHDSGRTETLTAVQYKIIKDAGFDFATAPITNLQFYQRVLELYQSHLQEREDWVQKRGLKPSQIANPSLPGPVVPTLTNKDTSYHPNSSSYGGNDPVAYSSPWIDLASTDPVISNISRQVFNIEVAYAAFCGATSIIVPGPRSDENAKGVLQYARAIQEAFKVAPKLNLVIHMPMYREPGLDETAKTLSSIFAKSDVASNSGDIDLFTAWDSWNTIRTVCRYTNRLFVSLRIPRRVPEVDLQDRWFAEPLHYLTIAKSVFQTNKAGHPSLSRHHQDMINRYMRHKHTPWMFLTDVGPWFETPSRRSSDATVVEFPTIAQAEDKVKAMHKKNKANEAILKRNNMYPYVAYMRYLERQQPPYSAMETEQLLWFQDLLQSPLQPLSDNLESATYETFEQDPVKYERYETAIAEAMTEWRELNKPTSSATAKNPSSRELIVAVAGAGRGPLVTRALRAAERTGTAIQLWALEKNQNAYVYLLRQNESEWNNQVTVVKTDMRAWEGPRVKGEEEVITKVDILVSELLGSFGDNELSPECLDGIQNHIARPHGISVPSSYTAHLSPICAPRLYSDVGHKSLSDPNAFVTPWVSRLFAIDFVAAQKVPGHPRFQQAWEFVHPVEVSREDDFAAKHGRAAKFTTIGGGSMAGSSGINDHNSRQCHLKFVCRTRGVMHGLAGYFESVLYASQIPDSKKEPVEISILPDQIDRKCKDMTSWFPIFFPLRKPLYFPQDSELEVSMWRQTDDTRVWYEWIVEAYACVGENKRIKFGSSDMHSSRNIACLM
ncbi:hypothetical protein QBC37DRAFT_54988 [Rhypophila decipiens]|uniref:Protein arginine N-methyltransferase n=1 Tax=Rhypophila decipiens TaxID=261697 RepID=A0AAN7B5Z1_9PEZI|nr:hypothetical protein QBC37DRAFT_54988 [Rhypophila decipiens]